MLSKTTKVHEPIKNYFMVEVIIHYYLQYSDFNALELNSNHDVSMYICKIIM